jgi:hypothetical protein
MIAVIQCAASKRSDAGHLLTANGKPVVFVAHPEIAPADRARVYARPDDMADRGRSWRDVLLDYNKSGKNPFGLLPAYQLYENEAYRRLVKKFQVDRVYILSAGWGLIKSDFLTPYYDITFSPSARGANAYKRRTKADKYRDLSLPLEEADEEIVFFGGKDYVSLFCTLTSKTKGMRKIFYSADQAPQAPGCATVKFETKTKTNWHYQCLNAFLNSV